VVLVKCRFNWKRGNKTDGKKAPSYSNRQLRERAKKNSNQAAKQCGGFVQPDQIVRRRWRSGSWVTDEKCIEETKLDIFPLNPRNCTSMLTKGAKNRRRTNSHTSPSKEKQADEHYGADFACLKMVGGKKRGQLRGRYADIDHIKTKPLDRPHEGSEGVSKRPAEGAVQCGGFGAEPHWSERIFCVLDVVALG